MFTARVLVFLSLACLTRQRLDTAWDEFDLEKSDEHLIHEHFVGWVFGHLDGIDANEFYFQAHDTDRDSKLDGLELFHALHHQNVSRHSQHSSQSHFYEDSLTVDLLLKQADADNDGYLDYYEYILSRKRYKAV